MWFLNSPHGRNSVPSLDLYADFLSKKFHRTEIARMLLNRLPICVRISSSEEPTLCEINGWIQALFQSLEKVLTIRIYLASGP